MLRERTTVVRVREGFCITKGHGSRVERCRGLCGSCYNGYRDEVEAGKTTWTELEDLGLSLPSDTAKARIERAREEKKQCA